MGLEMASSSAGSSEGERGAFLGGSVLGMLTHHHGSQMRNQLSGVVLIGWLGRMFIPKISLRGLPM